MSSVGNYSIQYTDNTTGSVETMKGMDQSTATKRYQQMQEDPSRYSDVQMFSVKSLASPSTNPSTKGHSYSPSKADQLAISTKDGNADQLEILAQDSEVKEPAISSEQVKDAKWKANVLESLTELKSKLDDIDLGASKKKSKFKPVATNVKQLLNAALQHAGSQSSSKAELATACLKLENEIGKLKIGSASTNKTNFKSHCDEFVKSLPPAPRGRASSQEIKFAEDESFGQLYTALKENYFHANREVALEKAGEIYASFQEHASKQDSYLIFGGSTALCALGYEVGPGDFDVYTNDTGALQSALKDSGYGDDIQLNQRKRYAIGDDAVPSVELPGSIVSAKERALKSKDANGPESNSLDKGGIKIVSPEYLKNQYQSHQREKDQGKIAFLKGL